MKSAERITMDLIVRRTAREHRTMAADAIAAGINKIAVEKIRAGERNVFMVNTRHVFDPKDPTIVAATVESVKNGVAFVATADGEKFAAIL
jgi:hypothetical protein